MSIDARLSSLGQRHQSLKNLIEEEMRRPSYDELRLNELKRKKLAIKDEILTLRSREH